MKTRGIYWEKARNRWRVRLYKQGHVVHRSYHRCPTEAMQALQEAKQLQKQAKINEIRCSGSDDLLNALQTAINPVTYQ